MGRIDDLLDTVEDGQSIRMDCPVCYGEKTLGITNHNGKISYNCFRAQCTTYGIKSSIITLEHLKKRLVPEDAKPKFEIPKYFIMGIANEKILNLLTKTNSLEPYKKGYFKIAYDPRLNRLAYLISDNNTYVGCVGRTLGKDKPKTIIYPGSAPVPLLVGIGKTLVITEDCASAISISNFPEYTGSPLLGTQLREEYLSYYLRYDKLIISLDHDARKKALKIRQLLTYFHKNVILWITQKDFKDMTNSEIMQFLEQVDNE